MSTTEAKPQTSIYETTIENAELEAALEEREELKAAAGEARKAFTEVDAKAKGIIASLDLGDAPVRVGGYVIVERTIAGRSVSFETQPSTRISISLLDQEE